MNDLNIKEVSDICVACGMCCDGTLFKFGNIVDEADKQNVIAQGLEIQFQNEKWVFNQPCAQFKGCCQIYGQSRPIVCDNFFCDSIKNAKSRNITWHMAVNQIFKAKELSNDLKIEYGKFEEFKNLKWREFFNNFDPILEESNPKELKKYGFLIIKFIAYKNAIKIVYTPKPKKEVNSELESVVK